MGATVIDSLIVKLGLDPKGVQQGRRQADEEFDKLGNKGRKTSETLEKSGKDAAGVFTRIGKEVAGLLVGLLSVRAIASFTAQITQADRATGMMADNLGMTVHELSIWHTAIEKVGGTAASIDADFRKLNETFLSWKYMGDIPEPLVLAMQRLNIDSRKFADSAVPLPEKIKMIADALNTLPGSERLYWMGKIGGSDTLANLIKGGRVELNKVLAVSEEINSITDTQRQNADKLSVLWWEMTNRIQSAGRTLKDEFQEPLERSLELANKILAKFKEIANYGPVKWLREHTPQLEGVRNATTTAIGKVAEFDNRVTQGKDNSNTLGAVGNNVINLGKAAKDTVFPPTNKKVSGTIRYPGAGATSEQEALPLAIEGLGSYTRNLLDTVLQAAKENKAEVIKNLDQYGAMVSDPSERTKFLGVLRDQLGVSNGARLQNGGSPVVNIKNETRVDSVIINTQATDTRGIVADFHQELIRQTTIGAQVNSGPGNY